ncbi:hypothetical protein BJV82DRAFT_582168 [Fennellomyces sp. T-0311]|nr:hypothetical protein BJV82DRAFT_582168 [Fennellomyces sp. T-0311]
MRSIRSITLFALNTDQRNLERAATHVPQDNTGTVPMNTQEASSRSISTATQEFTGCQLLTSDDDQHDGGFSDYDKPTVQSVQNSPPPTDAEASIVNGVNR